MAHRVTPRMARLLRGCVPAFQDPDVGLICSCIHRCSLGGLLLDEVLRFLCVVCAASVAKRTQPTSICFHAAWVSATLADVLAGRLGQIHGLPDADSHLVVRA